VNIIKRVQSNKPSGGGWRPGKIHNVAADVTPRCSMGVLTASSLILHLQKHACLVRFPYSLLAVLRQSDRDVKTERPGHAASRPPSGGGLLLSSGHLKSRIGDARKWPIWLKRCKVTRGKLSHLQRNQV
jgi:hypothetical protein